MFAIRRHSRLEWQEIKAAYLFILPAVIGVFVFAILPSLYGMGLSFYEFSFLGMETRYIGGENYRAILRDPLFFQAMRNSFVFAIISVVLHVVGGLGLALLIKQRVKGLALFRTAYFIPVVVSMAVASTIWKLIYHTNSGLLNSIIVTMGFPAQPFLTSPAHVLPSLAIMSFWKQSGFIMLIYLGALHAIPTDLYESAKIDGANSWQSFRSITLPLLRRVILFVLVITTIDSIKVFTQVYVMTDGGPLQASTVIIFHIFRNGFRYFNMGYAAAMSAVLFVIVLIITLVQFRLFRSDTQY